MKTRIFFSVSGALAGLLASAPLTVIAQSSGGAQSPMLSAQVAKDENVRTGIRGGALAGAALGALSGNAGAGAVTGAVTGGFYMYDQGRQDDRTQILADGIAGKQQPAQSQQAAPATPAPNQVQATVETCKKLLNPSCTVVIGLTRLLLGRES